MRRQNKIKAKYALLGDNLDIFQNIELELDSNNKIIEITELKQDLKENTILFPGFFNSHIHSADIGLRGVKANNLEELVGPNSIKSNYLQNLTKEQLMINIKKSYNEAKSNYIFGWLDFRESDGIDLHEYPYKNYYIPMCRPTKTTINQIPNFAHIGFRDVIVLEEEELIQVAKDGKMMNKNIQIHASEDYNLREKWINEYSESDIIWSIKNLNVDSIVHLTHADENDIMVMKKNKISAILCISSNIFTKVGIPPLKLIMDEGINIAIGTDNAMINELNLIQEMRLINRQINLPLKVLKMATINGAKVGKVNWGIKIGCSNFIKINFQNYNNKDIIYDYIINSEWYRRKNSIWQPRDYGMEI